jgi:hypothetical protein
MTTKQIDDKAWLDHPFTFRNNRGSYKPEHGGYIRYGIPEPPSGRREHDDELKGGDRIGWTEIEVTPEMVGKKIAVFTNIEIKGPGDRLKEGQIKWHNQVIDSGGISKIYKEEEVICEKMAGDSKKHRRKNGRKG